MLNIKEFIDGIFSLRTRRFGTVAEIMIKKIFGLEWSGSNSHDLYDSNQKEKIEVKFSTALKSSDEKINENNIIDEILKSRNLQRIFSQKEWNKYNFDCNIQQVKKSEFDALYYGIFFADVIEIFYIKQNDINEAIKYSNKQHRGNEGEGQFHLNNKTYEYHKENFFLKSITYEKLLEILLK